MDLVNKNIISLIVITAFVSTMAERSILVNPDNATISLGDTVTFSCTVTVDNTAVGTTVAWYQGLAGNGRVISSNYDVNNKVERERYTVTSENVGQEYNLQITDVKALDAGEYKCIIQSDSDGTILASSPVVWLNYKHAPRSSFPECQPSGELNYNMGDEVTFSCRSELGVPPVQLTWTMDDGTTVDAQQVTENALQIAEFSKTITREDNGRSFECELHHDLVDEKRFCVVGKLNVQFPPTNVEITSTVDETLEIGSTFSASCTADANPPIDPSNIQWSLSSDIPESKIQRNGQILVITDIEAIFSGTVVQCRVENDLGESSASFILEIVIPPTTTPEKVTTTVKPTTPTETTPSVSTTIQPKPSTVLSSLKAAISSSTSGSKPTSSTPATTAPLRVLPDEKETTRSPALTLDKILGVERNFLIALMIGAGFIILCFILLLLLVLSKKRGKTIVVVDSQDNLRKFSLSEASVNGTNVLIRTPVMNRRNRTKSENPSDNQSVDSAIQLVSPICGDQPDYRGQPIQRNKSNLSSASSQFSGNGYFRVPSTELLIDPQAQVRLERPQYVVYDMVSQNGTPFPSAGKNQNIYQYATTGRPQARQVDTSRFETIPLRTVRQEQDNELYIIRDGEYIPVQRVRDSNFPSSNSQVKILIGGSDNSSEEEVNVQESSSLLDPKHHPV